MLPERFIAVSVFIDNRTDLLSITQPFTLRYLEEKSKLNLKQVKRRNKNTRMETNAIENEKPGGKKMNEIKWFPLQD